MPKPPAQRLISGITEVWESLCPSSTRFHSTLNPPHPVRVGRLRFRGWEGLLRCLAGVQGLLGGPWVVISGAISPIIWAIITVTLRITPLITTHEPSSRVI